jgi:hypothetical protein
MPIEKISEEELQRIRTKAINARLKHEKSLELIQEKRKIEEIRKSEKERKFENNDNELQNNDFQNNDFQNNDFQNNDFQNNDFQNNQNVHEQLILLYGINNNHVD